MGRRKKSVRRQVERKKIQMRSKRSTLITPADSEHTINGPWEPVHRVDESLGLGRPSPSGRKLPNARLLSTQSRSLSIPVEQNRGVPPRSDSPSCVCTPPRVPLSRADSAGQTKTTDQSQVSLPECNSGSETIRKVERNMIDELDQRTMNDESMNIPHENERSINETQNISQHSPNTSKSETETVINQTENISQHPIDKRKTNSPHLNQLVTDINTKSNNGSNNTEDVIFVSHKEPDVYKFNPLHTSSRTQILKLLNINTTQIGVENVADRKLLGSPTKTHPTTADGNCFFRALSYAITGTEKYYRILRNQVIYHMLDNATVYNCHLRSGYGTVSNYITKKGILRDGVWATEVEILAAADLMNTDLFVFEESNTSWIKFSPRQVHGNCAQVSEDSIYLVHKYQAHYDVVLDVFGKENVETFAGNKQTIYNIVRSAEQDYPDAIVSHSSDNSFVSDLPPISDLPPVIQGHFNQSNARFLHNAGKQCVMNSLSAAIFSQLKPTTSWTADDVDQILIKGNDMYEFVQRSRTIHHDFLLISDIPESMEYNGIKYEFVFHEAVMGRLGGEPLREFNFYSLKDALMLSLQTTSDAVFVTFKNSTFIVIKQNGLFCVSDSHARSTKGTVFHDGFSTVIHYSNIEDVFRHTLSLAESMAYRDSDEFEVTPVNVSKVNAQVKNVSNRHQEKTANYETTATQDINSRLQEYLMDQKQKLAVKSNKRIKSDNNAKVSVSTRNEYMRTYMRKRRSEKSTRKELQKADTLRKQKARQKDQQRQRHIDLKSKRKLRNDPQFLELGRKYINAVREREPQKYKDIDLTSKRKLRKDPQFLEVERKSKIARREEKPEKYRDIDLSSKQKLRKDPQFLEEQNRYIKAVREIEPQKYKDIDFTSKRKLRKDPQFLEEERKSKIASREEKPQKYRDIDLVSKRKLRKDPQFLEEEKKSKIASREEKPQKYRDIDLASKRKLRKDPQFLEEEKKSKIASREEKPQKYRDIDLASKRKLRKDPQFLEEEKKSKIASREEKPQKYRDIDLASKRKLREDPQFLEEEKKSKIASREEKPQKYRGIDLTSKRKLRKDPQFLEIERKSKIASREEKPQKYRDIDLTSKRKLRKDPQFLEIERKSKIASREEKPQKYRDIDLTSKRKLRKDPQFLEVEKNLKIASREEKPQKYKNIDLTSKRKLRKDPKFLSRERKSKIASREKEPEKYKVIDFAHKRKLRQNFKFLEKERIIKKMARGDPHVLRGEAKADIVRKQKLRRDKSFLEQERLKQNERRKNRNAQQKHKDRKRKAIDRSSDLRSKAEHEQYKQRRYGQDVQQCIQKFRAKVERGPEYVCTVCHQTWFAESVVENCKHKFSNMENVYTGYTSVSGKEWICNTCLTTLKKGKIPKLAFVNGMKWPKKPPQLALHPLEERLVALRIPFMQIRELPRGGQFQAKGNVVNVPIDLQPIVTALPRRMDEYFAIPVKLKKRVSHKSHVFSENVRPYKILESLNWLMDNSDLYKNSGVNVNTEWETETAETSDEMMREFTREPGTADENAGPEELDSSNVNVSAPEDNNSFNEVNDDDCNQGNSDTLVDEVDLESNKTLILAPGENQQPLSLYHDKHAEILSFPSIYCGQRRLENDERKVPVPYSDIAKWELRSVDRRAATCVPNIFFKLNKIQRKQVADKVNLAVRRKKSEGKKITAKEARNPETVNKIVSLNEGYYIFRTLRNSPAYLSTRKKDIFAMIRQLGLPTWFMSLSCADTRWPELLKTLAAISGMPCSDEDISNMTWNDKAKLVQKDPVTACRYFDHRVQVFMNTVLRSEHSPIGIVTDSFQRVEFQNRGSPHVHMMIWTKNAPKYKDSSEEEIIQFVENHTSCSKDVDEDMQDLIKIQTHKHSKTCKKRGKPVCRFGFPLPPLRRTMILEPLDIEVEEYREKYKELHARMNDLKDECDLSYEEFLKTVVQMEEADYIKCIRSSLKGPKVFLKRKPSEMRVNYYNQTVLKAWGANIDLQFVLDPYACAMYIVSYISKSQRGMSTMLEQASKEAAEGNMDIKRQVRHIGNKFLNFVEISAQEAAYLVLQIPLTRSSRHVVFINTSPPEERVFLLKSQEDLENLPDSSTDIHSDNMMKRYAKRPKQLEKYCLANYVAELNVQFEKKENQEMECNEDDINVADSANESGSEEEHEFKDTSIVMKLRNGITIRRRKHPRVIRYVRYSAKTNAENFYREKLLLFMPWRCEEKDLKRDFDSYKAHFVSIQQDLIPVIKRYEHFVEELDLAREQAENDLDYDDIAPGTEQTEAEDADQSVNNSEEFFHFFPSTESESMADIGQDFHLPSTSTSTETKSLLLSDADYRKLVRSLNPKQREFFTHVLKWIATKDEPLYAFLSGGAGVGKSVVIRSLFQALHRLLNFKEGEDPDSLKILLTAFTGKAAYNINGCTIASAFHKKIFQREQHMHSDELNTFRTTYKDLKVIIIDEISMVGNKLLAFINQRLQELTGTKRDFGGISIIAVGDLYQLSPVADSWIFCDLSIGLATNLWKKHFHIFQLTEIMRQKDDLKFAEMLNRLRFNQLTAEDKDVIKSRTTAEISSVCPQTALHLFTENKRVNDFNRTLIEKLDGLKVEVKADTDVIAPSNITKESKSNLVREINKKEKHSDTGNLSSVLKLAVGMIYDVTVNIDVQDGLTNGASSTIQHIEYKGNSRQRPAIVWVIFEDPTIGMIRRNKYKHFYHEGIHNQWTPIFEEKRTFLYNKKTYERIQFPLIPAAAKTVHKAQGTTVDELVVDLRSSFKAPHIHYVALSRVRKLTNLHIIDFNEKSLTVDEKVHKEMERLKSTPLQLCFMPLYHIDNANLKFIFHNARSFHRHFEDVRKDPNVQSAHIVGIAETRLCSSESSSTYDIPGFQIHRIDETRKSDSQTRPHHGLLLYLKHDVTLQKLETQKYDGIEYALIDARFSMTDFQIIFLYKSPTIADRILMDCLQKIRSSIHTEKPLFFTGDFNIDIWKNASTFPQFMTDMFSCKQIIAEPTTVNNTLIDHVYTNVSAQATVVPTYWSDHSLICCNYFNQNT